MYICHYILSNIEMYVCVCEKNWERDLRNTVRKKKYMYMKGKDNISNGKLDIGQKIFACIVFIRLAVGFF